MADAFIQVPPNSTGLKLDTSELTVGVNVVERERINIADPTTAANIATVSAAGALKVDGSAVIQPVSGTVTANAGTGNFTVAQATAANLNATVTGSVTATQATGSNLHVVVDTAPTTAVTLPVGQAVELLDSGGTNKASISAAGAVKVDNSAVTQPVSGTVATKTALTASSPTAASVGITSAQALAANANRKGLFLVNTSSNTISIGFGVAAVLNSGITLSANGGAFSMNEYSFHTGAINAIAAGASSNLAIQEFTT